MDSLIEEEILQGLIIVCKCGALLYRDGNCYYVKCILCLIEWCFEPSCLKEKYKICNDLNHNSH